MNCTTIQDIEMMSLRDLRRLLLELEMCSGDASLVVRVLQIIKERVGQVAMCPPRHDVVDWFLEN